MVLLQYIAIIILSAFLGLSAIAVIAWQTRPDLDSIPIAPADAAPDAGTAVTVTWLGVTTLLFDDGETQILIDGFFTRPSIVDVLLNRPLASDAATIDYAMDQFEMQRLAAVIPLHSHFDHAMDIGAVANRSSASILGSESTANIARGAGVPEDQIVVVKNGDEYSFGQFTVRFVRSQHAPVGWGSSVPFSGVIDKPLKAPAPISAWREGGSFSIVVKHPSGTAVISGSAGFVHGALDNVHADVAFLGISMLNSLGRDYAQRYWQSMVTETGAKIVYPMHFDDVTAPFGTIRLPPKLLDDVAQTASWLVDIRNRWDSDTQLRLPVFGEPIALFDSTPPGT